MNAMNRSFSNVLLGAIVAAVSVHAEDNPVLLKVGDYRMTLSDFNRIIGYYGEEQREALEKQPELKATLLQRFFQTRLLLQAAKEKKFDQRPEIREQIDLLVADLVAGEYLKREVVGKMDVTDEDISTYYKANKDEFRTPETVRASHILFIVERGASEEDKQKAKEKAEEVLAKVKAGEDFGKLAQKYSEDLSTKPRGGDIGEMKRGQLEPNFEKALFALKPGEVSGVVETYFGYHIIKCTDRKESELQPLDKVKDQVRAKIIDQMKRKRSEAVIEKAMADTKAEINLDYFLKKK